MRSLRILAICMIIGGAALLAYCVAIGEMQVALVLIMPVIFGGSILGILAIGLIIAGVFIAIADSFLGAGLEGPQNDHSNEQRPPQTTRNAEFGGVVFIGPIPIIFGSSKKVTIYVAMIAVVILVLIVLALFLGRG